MRRLRVAFVAPRCWPHTGDAERWLSHFAMAWQAAGHAATIVTRQAESHWPRELRHYDVAVIHVGDPRARFWRAWRYERGVRRWLMEHRHEFDVVIACEGGPEARAALKVASALGLPVLLWTNGRGGRDASWVEEAAASPRARQRMYTASAFVTGSHVMSETLRALGFPAERTHGVPLAAPLSDRSASTAEARQALDDLHYALSLPPGAALAVCVSELAAGRGLRELVKCMPALLRAVPELRLWIVGDGPLHEDLMRAAHRLELTHRIILPGEFDDMAEVLAAADVYIATDSSPGMAYGLVEALAAGVPCLATDVPCHRELIENGTNGRLAPGDLGPAFVSAATELLGDSNAAAKLGAAALARSRAQCIDQSVAAFAELVERILDQG